MNCFKDLLDFIKKNQERPYKLAVCQMNNEYILEAIESVRKEGLIEPILVGFRDEIENVAASLKTDLRDYQIIHSRKKSNTAKKTVQMVAKGEADILMKGQIQTGEILREVLNKDNNLNIGRILSTLVIFNHEKFDKFLYISHASLNIYPDLKQKADIIQNVINFVKDLGVEIPVVAIISPVETVNHAMPETIDAACLSKMSERGTIKGGRVEGPLALDNALFIEAAQRKRIRSPYAGHADILFAQNLASADILYKSLTFLGNADAASILIGAKVPIVLTSRSDSVQTMINSIIVAVYSQYQMLNYNRF